MLPLRIRRAYKKKALELHPDRNFNDTENATRKFAEVQTAYEILSDPQERAWYDSHRDAILAGDDDLAQGNPTEAYSTRLTSAESIFTLMGRFNSSVPMTDSRSGFFGILDPFFEQLASEEAAACEWDGLTVTEYPPFGSANDSYDSVAKPFYNTWSSFSTQKSFSWKDKYRLSDAPDRRVRRLMEKENKKFRDEGMREFNDAVRSLVAFVRKRDPRYVPNTQSEAERQRVLRDSAAAQAARSRAANQEKLAGYVVPEWAQSRGDGNSNDEFSSETEEEEEVEHIECVVCDKTFKSEKQFEAHERSKKHVKAVNQLRWQMKKENADLDLDQHVTKQEVVVDNDDDDEDGLSGPHPEVTHADENAEDDGTAPPVPEEPADADSESAEDPLGDEYASRSEVENRLLQGQNQLAGNSGVLSADSETGSIASGVDSLSIGGGPQEKKIGKAKAKREKKAARAAAGDSQQGAVSPFFSFTSYHYP